MFVGAFGRVREERVELLFIQLVVLHQRAAVGLNLTHKACPPERATYEALSRT